ncbi:MAG: hypothetical protein IPM79_19935 [Polyangiaceae bacterium]|nr:hypothetical protein [Polyangiaceae bacterium]
MYSAGSEYVMLMIDALRRSTRYTTSSEPLPTPPPPHEPPPEADLSIVLPSTVIGEPDQIGSGMGSVQLRPSDRSSVREKSPKSSAVAPSTVM